MRDAPTVPPSHTTRLRVRLDTAFHHLERTRLAAINFAQRPGGYLLLLYPATVAWITLWAGYNLTIVGRAFPATPGSPRDVGLYWTATWWALFPVTTLLAFRKHAWLPILALLIGGWEDILFYWIQGGAVPAQTPWLVLTPTATLLYVRAGTFLGVSLVGAVLIRLPSFRIRYVPSRLSWRCRASLAGSGFS
jgi:hypothetical protein